MLKFVPEKMEQLAKFVEEVLRDKKLSAPEVSRRSSGGISQSQVHRIKTGEVKDPGPTTLRALADGLGVPAAEVYAVAYGVSTKDPLNETEVLAYFRELSPARQRDVIRIAKVFFDDRDREEEKRPPQVEPMDDVEMKGTIGGGPEPEERRKAK